MTTSLTTLSFGRSALARRHGETLIEIMASIMVLCIGLVGVLAAIPFGGFRLSQMTEADNSAAVGRNAVRLMRVNEWGNPNNWLVFNTSTPSRTIWAVGNPVASSSNILWQDIDDDPRLDIRYPFVVDPLGSYPVNLNYFPFAESFLPSSGYPLPLVHVCPIPTGGELPSGNAARAVYGNQFLTNWYERLFYQQDDVLAGYYENEDDTEFRPRVETEIKTDYDLTSLSASGLAMNSADISVPSFSGRYSWMAFVYPKSSSANITACTFNEIVSADYDAVVFRDRIVGDEKAFQATVSGSGYQGGTVDIDLSTGDVSDSTTDNNLNTAENKARIREQLTQTRYILLAGQDDFPKGGVYPTFARWYKIANYADLGNDIVRLTLIGPDAPSNWSNGGSSVTAVLYPGVIGVYSGSSSF